MGHDSPINGDAGEGLFEYLACFLWRAKVLRHPTAWGTDTYIRWHDLTDSMDLLVQVKARKRLGASSKSIELSLRPSEIRGWAARRPLLVLCDLTNARAWWLDTDDLWVPSEPIEKWPVTFSLAHPVDETTRNAVRSIAVARCRESLSYPSLPKRLRGMKDDRLEGLVEDSYAEIGKAKGLSRDAIALANARVVQRSRVDNLPADLNRLIEPMVKRIESKEQGGRSHSLAALMGVLLRENPRPGLRTDLGSRVADVAEAAVTSGDFVHSEFGMITLARLVEFVPNEYSERFKNLLSRAADMNQTERFHAVVGRLKLWEPAKQSLRDALGQQWISKSITRWSDRTIDAFNRQVEAEEIVERAIRLGAKHLSSEELKLLDYWTRYRADQFLQHDLGPYLFGKK